MPKDVEKILGRQMVPDKVHPSYAAYAEERALSLALQIGTSAMKRDALTAFTPLPNLSTTGAGGQRWFWPESPEEVIPETIGGKSLYDRRVQRMRTENVFAECVRSTAAAPFGSELEVSNWHAVLLDRFQGKNGGIDGRGGTITDFYRTAFERKLFAGVHFVRVATAEGLPIWYHLDADDLLDWDWTFDRGTFRLLGAVVQVEGGRRLVFNTYRQGSAFSIMWEEHEAEGSGSKFKLVNSGKSSGDTVPIVPWYTDWGAVMYSPPPFADAARSQAEVIRARSLADNLRRKISCSDAMVITGWAPMKVETKEGGISSNPEAEGVPRVGSMLCLPNPEARAQWQSIDSGSLDALERSLESDLASIRRQCMDPLRQTWRGDVKATEINFHGHRARSYLEALVKSDLATLRTAAGVSCKLLGLPVPESGLIDMNPDLDPGAKDAKRAAALDRIFEWRKAGAVSEEFFLTAARHLSTDIPPEVWDLAMPALEVEAEPEPDDDQPLDEQSVT